MNVNQPSKSRITIRGIVLVLTGIFIGVPLLACLWIEFSISSDLKQQLAKVEKTREELQQSTREARKLRERFLQERTQAYWHERHIIDLLDQCRHIKDLPNFKTDFIICKELADDPDSGGCWIVVPQGNHQLQIKITEFDTKSLTNEQLFAYPLLAESSYKLRFKIPGSPYQSLTSGKPNLEPTPIVLVLESNNPEFKAIEETLPVKFYRRVGTTRSQPNSQLTSLVLRFPSECYGERLRFSAGGMITPQRDFQPTTKTAQLSGVAWRLSSDNQRIPTKSMFISIEVSSDAPACAAPFLSVIPELTSKFQPYSGSGRFLPIDAP